VARRNNIETHRLQLTVDDTTNRIVESMVPLGIHGANKAEVATWIIRTWIWENQQKLLQNGIKLAA